MKSSGTKRRNILFRVTAIIVFLQVALGGLLTFGYIEPLPHIINGFLVLALVIAILVLTLTSKPRMKQLQGLSIGLVVLTLIQIILGFATLGSHDLFVAWVHLLVAVGIYGMIVSGTFMAMREDYRARGQSAPDMGAKEKPI